jgi:branched-chain amino acid aminotransferase
MGKCVYAPGGSSLAEDELVYWLNGELVPKSEARVSVLDHGFLYGDGVFEGIRVYNNRVFKLHDHLVRLFDSAKFIDMDIGMTIEEVEAAVLKTLRANGMREAYIRLVVSRGVGDLGLDPRKCDRPTVVIITDKIALYPPEVYETGIELCIVATRRNLVEAVNARVKSLNYLNNILAKIEVNKAGLGEGIMLHENGLVCEATADNIFIVKGDRFITPPAYLGALEGITRNTILELAAQAGYGAGEAPFTRFELYSADEVFMTGTGAEIMPVIKIDGRSIGDGKPGKKTLEILAKYRELTRTDGPIVMEE